MMTWTLEPAPVLLRPWLRDVPKVELHVHLEGAIPHVALWELLKKYGGDTEIPTPEDLTRRFRYRSFEHFIDTWVWKNSYLRSYDDFTFLAEAVARQWARQHIVYVEAFYSPGDFARHGLGTQELTCAIRRGLARVPEVQVMLVADLVRDFGPRRALATLSEVQEVRSEGVIGVGLGGSEPGYPPEPFAFVFALARRHGFHVTVHAGEAAGAASVRGALDSLGAERLGHATRAPEDSELLRRLVAERIPLELCPHSNCATGVIPSLSRHPVRRFFDLGMRISVNTDDPAMFGLTLADELDLVARTFSFTDGEVHRLVCDAARSSWLPVEERRALTARLARHPAWPPSVRSEEAVRSPNGDE